MLLQLVNMNKIQNRTGGAIVKNLVVYYTLGGNTEIVAKEVHKLVGGDIKKIEEKKQRTEKGFGIAAFSALIGMRSSLKPFDFSLQGYDNIFIGAQVWAGHSTPAINSFLAKADLKNKNVFLFITKADSKVPQAVIDSITKRVQNRGGRVISNFSTTTVWKNLIKSEEIREEVKSWVNNLNINQ